MSEIKFTPAQFMEMAAIRTMIRIIGKQELIDKVNEALDPIQAVFEQTRPADKDATEALVTWAKILTERVTNVQH